MMPFSAIYGSPLAFLIMLAPLGFIIALNMGIARMKESIAQIYFGHLRPLWGLCLQYLFSILSQLQVFFISAGAFGALSLYGYTTKKDLTGWGSFLFIGLIGILIASIVNIFVASTALQFGISVIGVLVFAGLTAYDTQRINDVF